MAGQGPDHTREGDPGPAHPASGPAHPASGQGLRCHALLFDLDGVLVDSVRNTRLAWLAWADRHGLDGDEVHRIGHGRRSEDTVAAVAPWLDPEPEVAFVERLESTTTMELDRIPGAAELLAALPADAWAIVTSGTRAVALHRIAFCGLPTPSVLLTAEDVSRGKPDPQGYLEAAARLGRSPTECVVVEDAAAGVAAAHAAGMRAVLVGPEGGNGVTADLVARALSDLCVLVEGGTLFVSLDGPGRPAGVTPDDGQTSARPAV